jgi:6-pyruvoyltetrahydropterin/6-carboxytetrahydropterin synthase
MYSVTIQRHFDAAHHLNNYEGKCANTHGHRWIVEVKLTDANLDDVGMLIDFTNIKSKLDTIINELDHQYLNLLPQLSEINPTAENLARYIYFRLKPIFWILDTVRVYESPESWAEYYD